ncbi:Uncharacterised protein [uncultured archaeon]|nr:Uncharacterised protein [uncultured archaeon]
MQHVAILTGNFLDKILSGEKTIETRWYKSRRAPFRSVSSGDTIYLKQSGGPVIARCAVVKSLFFEDLDRDRIADLLRRYGKEACIGEEMTEALAGKRYCTLIWLGEVTRLDAPFDIDKTGFGNMCAWIRVEDVDRIKR